MTLRKKAAFSLFFAVETRLFVLTLLATAALAAFVGTAGGCRAIDGAPSSYSPCAKRLTPSNAAVCPIDKTSANAAVCPNPSFQPQERASDDVRTPSNVAPKTVSSLRPVDDSPSTATATARGQAPDDGAAPFPTTTNSAFPTLGNDFPTSGAAFPTDDGASTPPTSSELSPFIVAGGANVSEPTADYAPATSDPEPRRESISDREETERRLEESYASWIENQKAKQQSQKKTPRYLQPLPNDRAIFTDPSSPFARSEKKEDEFIRQITAADLSMMTENDDSQTSRDLLDWEKEEPTPIDWSKYALTMARIRGWLGMGPDEREALEYMRQACEKQKEYAKTKEPKLLKEAANLYERAARTWPGPALDKKTGAVALDVEKETPSYAKHGGPNGVLIEEDGLFFAGECWFFYKDYNRALHCYKALVSTYNSTIYKKTAMRRLYFIGCYWTEISEQNSAPSINVTDKDKPRFSSFAGAQKAFETIFLNDASDSGLAPAALFALANAYMRRGVNQGDGAFDSAARYYKQLYEFYPGSKYAENACLLAMIALHKSYQGPFYDEAPLDEARKLAETALASGRCKIDVVNEELENIKDEQAKHLFVAGQYYEKRGNYASARSFYNRLVREHPNSYYATEAARAYENIEEKPAEADQFAWIRPIAPFIPKSKNQYFEEAPDSDMSKIARRDESLDQIGDAPRLDGADNSPKEENVATAPDSRRRY